ncbi:hypothetical protein Tco_1072215 [Tanacetum coccineum]
MENLYLKHGLVSRIYSEKSLIMVSTYGFKFKFSTIMLAQYEDEGWNDALIPDEMSLNHENPDIEQLLGIIKHKVDTLMKDAISLMKKSESVFRLIPNEIYRPPSEPSRQEEFEHIVMNFIFDQEERITQLEDYMKIEKITKYPDTKVLENNAKYDFLENLEKKAFPTPANLLCVMSKRSRSTRGQASSSREETMEEKVRKFRLFNNGNHQMNYNNLAGRSIHPEDVVDGEFLFNKGLAQPFFNFINIDTFSGPQWVNLFQINEPIFRELVREFFASFEFDASPCRYEPLHKGVTFRLGGVEREISLLKLGWRVGLYSEGESRDVATLSGLRGAEIVNSTRLTHLF